MEIVLMRSSDHKSVRPSMLYVKTGWRTVCRVLLNAAHQSIPSRRTSVVRPKLSRSDLVQERLCQQTGVCCTPLRGRWGWRGLRLARHVRQELLPGLTDEDQGVRCTPLS